MNTKTKQVDFWQNDFGKEYTQRNTYSKEELDEVYQKTWGITKSAINEEFFGNLDRDIKILEVGCNVGQQLRHLQNIGFKNLYGIEIQETAVEEAKSITQNINIIYGEASDIPFKDQWFDLVFTAGVLIHISPSNLPGALKEIVRCSRKYIWGHEYYSPELEEILYRGHKGVLWKQDFRKLYTDTIGNLKLIKEKKVKYVENENVDQMFLLERE